MTTKSVANKSAAKKGKSFARRLGVDDNADYAERKLMVLRAAARLFSEKGVTKTSIDDICSELGVTKPTVYHYVKNKDEIIRECLKISDERLDELKEAILGEGTGLEGIEEYVSIYLDGVTNDFARMYVNMDPHVLSEDGQRDFFAVRKRTIGLMRSLVERGIKDGSVQVEEPMLLTMTLLGALNFVGQWYQAGGVYALEDVQSGIMQIFKNGVAE